MDWCVLTVCGFNILEIMLNVTNLTTFLVSGCFFVCFLYSFILPANRNLFTTHTDDPRRLASLSRM